MLGANMAAKWDLLPSKCLPLQTKGWFAKNLGLQSWGPDLRTIMLPMLHHYLFYFHFLSNEISLELLAIGKEVNQLLDKNDTKQWRYALLLSAHMFFI